jgi:hypothetical protein
MYMCTCVHIFCTIFNLSPPFPTTSPIPLVPTPFSLIFLKLSYYPHFQHKRGLE